MEFCFNGTELEFHLLKILNTGWCWGLGFTEITRPNVKLLLKQGLWLRLKFRVGEKTWKEKKSLRIAQLLKLALVWLAVYFYLLGLWCGWGFVLEYWWYSVRKSKTVKDFKKTKIRKHRVKVKQPWTVFEPCPMFSSCYILLLGSPTLDTHHPLINRMALPNSFLVSVAQAGTILGSSEDHTRGRLEEEYV